MLKTASLKKLAVLAHQITGTEVLLEIKGDSLVWTLPYEPLCKGFMCLGSTDGDLRRVFNSFTAWSNFFDLSLVPLRMVVKDPAATELERQVYTRMRGGK